MPIFHLSDEPQEVKANDVLLLDNAITFYVRTDGRDTNSGQSPDRAWKTLSHAYRHIKNKVIANNCDIYLDIESGAYPIDDLVQTFILSSPVHLDNENFVVVPREDQFDQERLEKSIKEAYTTLASAITNLREEFLASFLSTNESHPTHDQVKNSIGKHIRSLTEFVAAQIADVVTSQEKANQIQKTFATTTNEIASKQEDIETRLTGNLARIEALSENTIATSRQQNLNITEIQRTNQAVLELRTTLTEATVRISELAKADKKLEPTLSDFNTSLNELIVNLSALTSRFEAHVKAVRVQFEETASNINEHITAKNPHEIRTSELTFDGKTVAQSLLDLYSRTKSKREFVNNTFTIEDVITLNTQLQAWNASCDFVNKELTIDLQGKLHEDVHLVNISTASKVRIMNGLICGLRAKSVHTPYEFENVTFLTQSSESLVKNKYAIDIRVNSNVTLIDCKIRAGENGCVKVSSGSFLQLRSSVELPDKEIPTVVFSELNAIVNARGIIIVPNIKESHINCLGWAESNSIQDWRDADVEGESLSYTTREHTGGRVLDIMAT